MRFRSMAWLLVAAALTAAPALAVDEFELGFVDDGEALFEREKVQSGTSLSGSGLIETWAVGARIALEVGGHMKLDPGTQVRIVYREDGTTMATVVRGKVTLLTTSGGELTAGANSVFRIDRETMKTGRTNEPTHDDDR